MRPSAVVPPSSVKPDVPSLRPVGPDGKVRRRLGIAGEAGDTSGAAAGGDKERSQKASMDTFVATKGTEEDRRTGNRPIQLSDHVE